MKIDEEVIEVNKKEYTVVSIIKVEKDKFAYLINVDNYNDIMFAKIKKEVDNQELTDEEKEYIKDHVKQWACDNDLLHDLQRHIFKKLIDNKEKLLKDLDKKKF